VYGAGAALAVLHASVGAVMCRLFAVGLDSVHCYARTDQTAIATVMPRTKAGLGSTVTQHRSRLLRLLYVAQSRITSGEVAPSFTARPAFCQASPVSSFAGGVSFGRPSDRRRSAADAAAPVDGTPWRPGSNKELTRICVAWMCFRNVQYSSGYENRNTLSYGLRASCGTQRCPSPPSEPFAPLP
jgi:hypothetical protein